MDFRYNRIRFYFFLEMDFDLSAKLPMRHWFTH